jgi:hypothetical protein
MSISVLNNVSSLMRKTHFRPLSRPCRTPSRSCPPGWINSGADDPAGLSIANGLGANIAALTQSSQNASNGIGLLQTADGALSQVTTVLNQAVTIATEAANGGSLPASRRSEHGVPVDPERDQPDRLNHQLQRSLCIRRRGQLDNVDSG